jgi:hypothetical protein
MAETYSELKTRHREQTSTLPIHWAFGNKQMDELLEKLGHPELSTLASLPGGGIILKTDGPKITEMVNTLSGELSEALKDDVFLENALVYELGNHEYCITGDPEDTFRALGILTSRLEDDPAFAVVFGRARQKCMAPHWDNEEELLEPIRQ